jgi:hypothetical protein
MAPNTTIESLLVDGQKVIARFSSTNSQAKYEAKLDGWFNWKAVPNPATFSDLNPGNRTLYVRAISRKGIADPTPAAKQFTIQATEPPPPPPPSDPPPTDLPLVAMLDTVAKWSSVLNEAPNSTITNVSRDGQPALRLYQPGDGERTELQFVDKRIGDGVEALYRWECLVPGYVKLPDLNDDNIINQQHGNYNAGFTGGLSIRLPSNKIAVRVKGGQQLSTSGSHRYEYESDGKNGKPPVPEGADEFGVFTRDVWHRIDYRVKWSTEWNGYVYCTMDGGPPASIKNVPTFSKVSDAMMTRVGWYPTNGDTNGPLEMFVRKFQVFAKV